MTPGRLPREEREDARVGARGGGLLRHAAALAWKLLSPAARAAAFAVEETIPRPVARVFAASLCCPGDQGAGRHPAGGARGEKRRSLAGGRVGARPRNGIRGTWWRRLDPGEVSASDPPAPSCLLNAAPPPPDPAPRCPHSGLSVCVSRCGWGRWTARGGSWLQGSPDRGSGEVTFVDPNSCKPVRPRALEKQV